MEPLDKREIGRRFARFMEITGRKQGPLAQILNTSQQTVSNIKTGKYVPDTRLLTALALEFGLNVNWLLFQRGDMFEDNDLERERRFEEKYPELSVLLEMPDVAHVIFGKLIECKALLKEDVKSYRAVNPPAMS
jgi:transcriptional regulator with XRE-family HTH domain